MVQRDLTARILDAAGHFPVITVTGPRQSGKSTLCRAVFPKHPYVSLEAADTRQFALLDPKAFVNQLPYGAVIDEVQRCPELPSYLQLRVDEDPAPGRWVLTGSQNILMLESVSQSLAGRTAVLNLLPLARGEARRFPRYPRTLDEAMLTGGYPRILDQQIPPGEWLDSYISTYVERDVRTVANIGDLIAFQRFLGLCAGRTSQLLNLSTLGTDASVSQPTAKAWLSVLETGFIVTRLSPYFANIGKRLVKTPKLHFYDTGLVCALLSIRNVEQLRLHPLRGAIFETWVVCEIIKHRINRGERRGINFYRDQQGLEADLVVSDGSTLTLVEAKASQTVTPELLANAPRLAATVGAGQPTRTVIVYGGSERQERTGVTVLPWDQVSDYAW